MINRLNAEGESAVPDNVESQPQAQAATTTQVPVLRSFRVDASFNVVINFEGDFVRLQVSSPSASMITLRILDIAGNPIPIQPPIDRSIRGSLIIQAKGLGNMRSRFPPSSDRSTPLEQRPLRDDLRAIPP